MLELLCNCISYPYTAVANWNTKEIKLCYMMALFTAISETRSVRNKRSGNRVPHCGTFRKPSWRVSCAVTSLQSRTHPSQVFTLFHNWYDRVTPPLAFKMQWILLSIRQTHFQQRHKLTVKFILHLQRKVRESNGVVPKG
jgi:hypothetical protein